MGEFWGFVDWGAGCLALIVAVVFSFLLGVRTGRIRERNESVRSRIRQNKANMYRYKQRKEQGSLSPTAPEDGAVGERDPCSFRR